MDWRKFKRLPAVEKVEKVEMPPILQDASPFSTLNTFSPCSGDLKNAEAPPRHRPDSPTSYEGRLSLEAERRADFCQLHRQMLGGTCERLEALDGCLLWRLIQTGKKIEGAATAKVVESVTVADVLAWVANSKDVEAVRHERRLLLTVAVSMPRILH